MPVCSRARRIFGLGFIIGAAAGVTWMLPFFGITPPEEILAVFGSLAGYLARDFLQDL